MLSRNDKEAAQQARYLCRLQALKKRMIRIANDFSIDSTELLVPLDKQIADLSQAQKYSENFGKNNLSEDGTKSITHVGDIPKLFIEARIQRGWTQSELARRCGLKPQQISRYEKSLYATIRLSKAIDLAKVLSSRTFEASAAAAGELTASPQTQDFNAPTADDGSLV